MGEVRVKGIHRSAPVKKIEKNEISGTWAMTLKKRRGDDAAVHAGLTSFLLQPQAEKMLGITSRELYERAGLH